jgi:hypothetical protein
VSELELLDRLGELARPDEQHTLLELLVRIEEIRSGREGFLLLSWRNLLLRRATSEFRVSELDSLPQA